MLSWRPRPGPGRGWSLLQAVTGWRRALGLTLLCWRGRGLACCCCCCWSPLMGVEVSLGGVLAPAAGERCSSEEKEFRRAVCLDPAAASTGDCWAASSLFLAEAGFLRRLRLLNWERRLWKKLCLPAPAPAPCPPLSAASLCGVVSSSGDLSEEEVMLLNETYVAFSILFEGEISGDFLFSLDKSGERMVRALR